MTELKDRSELLGERVSRLIAQRSSSGGHDDLAAARDLAQALENDTRALYEQVESIKRREAQLLMLLADRLLPEGEEQR